jgi:hypothetical protein
MKKFTSPKGISGFTWLSRPDVKFDADGKYKVDLHVSAAEGEKVIEMMREEAEEELGKKVADKINFPEENEDGTITLKFSTKAKDQKGNNKELRFFDGAGNRIDGEGLNIGNGSKLKIKATMKAYKNGSNVGVSLYIDSVQIIDLVEFGGSGFEADEEATYVAKADKASSKRSKQAEPEDEEEDEDVNF